MATKAKATKKKAAASTKPKVLKSLKKPASRKPKTKSRKTTVKKKSEGKKNTQKTTANKKIINIVHLYPEELNIYGDNGNVLTLKQRLEWRGYKTKVHKVGVGQKIPTSVDLIIAGGGQDKGQFEVEKDLYSRASNIKSMAADGVTMLAICGTYQLFGNRYITVDGKVLKGIGLFDMYTEASTKRLIGNIVIETPVGQVVGFENHSGQTYLGASQLYFGQVVKGSGNNASSKDEGALKHNTFGSYMHGPLLPKNPKFADELLRRTLERKFGKSELESLDDKLEDYAFGVAVQRPN